MTTLDTKVWGRLPPDVYIYFFRKIYAGDKGNKQELVARFFTALYKECMRKGIPAEWDPNSYSEIEKLMANINFSPTRQRGNTKRLLKSELQHRTKSDTTIKQEV